MGRVRGQIYAVMPKVKPLVVKELVETAVPNTGSAVIVIAVINT